MEDGASNYLNYIRCCMETERYNEAFQAVVKAAHLYPENTHIHSLLTLCLIDKGNSEEIFNTIKKLSELLYKEGALPTFSLDGPLPEKEHIEAENLVKEFLKNKDNNN